MSIKQNVMNSKIRINHEFDTNESYIQIELEDGDLNDNALKNFVEKVNTHGVELVYPKNSQDNRRPQLRVKNYYDYNNYI